MLNDLRDQTSFQEDEPIPDAAQNSQPAKRTRTFDQMTGMNAQQRFMLSVMLVTMLCLLGLMGLVVTGKIVPTFTFTL
jgi:hypothetical protein